MRLTQKIDKESLHNAMRKAGATEEIFSRVSERLKTEMHIIYEKGDERDLSDMALFLRYKPLFDNPKNGKPLSDSEFEIECEKLILAFANDDREKIYDYLDKWFEFSSNYNPPTEINNEFDALKHFVYLRSQQGLGHTKMLHYPEYVQTRFNSIDKIMKLQRVEQQMLYQTMWNVILFDDNEVEINVKSLRELDANKEEQLKINASRHIMFNEFRPSIHNKIPLANALVNAFDLDNPNPNGEASIKKLEQTEWVKSLKGKNTATDMTTSELQNVTEALRGALGSNETDYGLVHKYSDCGLLDLDVYKMIFIDGVNVFDSLQEPKNEKSAAIKLMDALANQTGVVSIVHVAEIDGKFEYRSDILDVRTGENDNPEYVEKIKLFENSEHNRKELFAMQKTILDNMLIGGREEFVKNIINKKRDTAIQSEKRSPYAKGNNDFVITANEQTIADAFKIIEDGRQPYLLTAKHLLANSYVDKNGNEQQNPVKYELSASRLNVDTRDFLDLILFERYAKTLGVGDKDLTEEETLKQSVKMIMSFVSQDRNEIKNYLDKMFDFLESYTPPKDIKTVEDVFKTIMYMRVQQTTIMKCRENPWYKEQRYPTVRDKVDNSAFEAEYLQIHSELLYSWVRDTGLNIGSGLDYKICVEKANARKIEKEEEPRLYKEMETAEKRTNQFHRFAYDYLSERRRRLAYADEFEKNYIFKLSLPQSAIALAGENPNLEQFELCADALWTGCISNVYNSTFIDSDALRSYGFKNIASDDAVHLIYIDGKSLYDISKEKNNGTFSIELAKNSLLSALVNQSGIVQFARIIKDGEEIKMELDTVDLIQKDATTLPEYVKKMSEFITHQNERYTEIKNNIVKVCNEKKAEVEANERNRQYVEGEANQWKDFAPDVQDLFAPSEYDKRVEAQARIQAYIKDQQDQWDGLMNAELDLFTGENFEIQNRPEQIEENEKLGTIENINFETFKNGRYVAPKSSPNSAYSVATMGELRELGVYFGSITVQNNVSEFIEINNNAGYVSLDDEDNQRTDYSNELAKICGLKIENDGIDYVIGNFILQNRSEDNLSVDKIAFEKQYKLLFGDLYKEALNNINKQCCKNGTTISAEQMNDTLNLLNEVMTQSAYRVEYPQTIINGGFSPEQIKTMQEDFLNNYVPQNSVEQAMRSMQANIKGYDFSNIDWKQSINYADFRNVLTNEQNKLNGNIANTPENKLKVIQNYMAMKEHNQNRTFWSKVFNVFKYFDEKRTIEAYKEQAITKFAISENDFTELCAIYVNNDIQTVKNDIQTNYQNMLQKQQQKDILSEYSNVRIGGMNEHESERDLENVSVLSSDNDETRVRISVNEARHKKENSEINNNEIKEIRKNKVIENNELKKHN